MPQDAELVELRERVDCRTVLERAGWQLDERESTRRAAKYRRGGGEIIIVTHDGKGWFDPLAEGARGDVVALAQRVWGGNLGHARKALRPLAGIVPLLLPTSRLRTRDDAADPRSVWQRRPTPRPGSAAWRYLTEERGLPASLLEVAVRRDLVREGVRGTAWFLHRIGGQPSGWEMRGPSFKGFLAGGAKGMFVFSGSEAPSRIAVCEAAIDALSLAVIEGPDDDTAYVSTGGGWGEAGSAAIGRLLSGALIVVAATDRGTGGELLAGRLEDLVRSHGVSLDRKRPAAKDWNEQLVSERHGQGAPRKDEGTQEI
jgi:hypothetical protein